MEGRRDHLARFWNLLEAGDTNTIAALFAGDASWDDPLYGAASGEAVRATAIPKLSTWCREKASGGQEYVRHLRTTAALNCQRRVIESVLTLKDGLKWDPVAQKGYKADQIELPVAVVVECADGSDTFSACRIYFGTWSVLNGSPRLRVGPIAPNESADAQRALDAFPHMRQYFDFLASGKAGIIKLFEPDGYFREPSDNYCCGHSQLEVHFSHILKLGGVQVEMLTATRQDNRLALELQTVTWGPKKMSQPQAGFASYELGPHGLLQGARVYDSVVPPEI